MNELEQLKRDSEVLYCDNVYLSEVCDGLRAENARLREELGKLKGFPEGGTALGNGPVELM